MGNDDGFLSHLDRLVQAPDVEQHLAEEHQSNALPEARTSTSEDPDSLLRLSDGLVDVGCSLEPEGQLSQRDGQPEHVTPLIRLTNSPTQRIDPFFDTNTPIWLRDEGLLLFQPAED